VSFHILYESGVLGAGRTPLHVDKSVWAFEVY